MNEWMIEMRSGILPVGPGSIPDLNWQGPENTRVFGSFPDLAGSFPDLKFYSW